MNTILTCYDIYPKVIPSHEKSTLTIAALDYSVHFEDKKKYKVVVLPLCESLKGESSDYTTFYLTAHSNKLLLTYSFGGEQEYYIRLLDEKDCVIVQLSVYAVDKDLYCCRPYKGDLHIHTCFSDGKESPELVAAKYRQYGFDFMAITDHHRYAPSLRAIEAYQDVSLGIKLFPGEEVHGLDNPIHIVNFGGAYSVNEMMQKDPDTYYKEVHHIESILDCPAGVNSFQYAACVWAYEHIKKGNGLSIFAHPHWIANVYHVRDDMTRYQMQNQPFDAFELIGGQSVIENNMQLAFFNDIQLRLGKHIPIVGSSDSHGVLEGNLFDAMKTVVLAPSNAKEDLITAIKDLKSVAIEHYRGEHYKVHGSYRMVSYVIFLLENYFPLHDELCYEEGRCMLGYIRGEEDAKEMLQRLVPRTGHLMEKYFGRSIG